MRRGVPVRRIGGHLVTTVFDLLAAQLGVGREGLPGEWPAGLDDPGPYTPAWQEEITGVDAGLVTRIAREFARNAERTNGRSMIVMGAGTNHWFHSDQIYRAMLSMVVSLYRRRVAATVIELAKDDPSLVKEVIARLRESGEIEADDLVYLDRIADRWMRIAEDNGRHAASTYPRQARG